MSGQQDVFQRGTLQRISSAGFIIGAVLLVVFNLLYPRPVDPSSTQSVLTAMADQRRTGLLNENSSLSKPLDYLFGE